MLVRGAETLFSNWRLPLIQILPAMWIWVAMLDLKVHAFKGTRSAPGDGTSTARAPGRRDHPRHSGVLLPQRGVRIRDLAAGPAEDPPGLQARTENLARRHWRRIRRRRRARLPTVVVPRWGPPWFALSLGIVLGVMMLTYVSLPARIVGIKPTGSSRDKMAAAAIGGTMSAIVSAPAYLIGRIGILLLGSKALFPLAVAMLVVGFALLAGATGTTKAIKMSAKLAAAGRVREPRRIGAGLGDVLGREPDRAIGVRHGGRIVAPALDAVAALSGVAGEAVSRADTRARDVDRAGAVGGVDQRVGRGRIVVWAGERERHDALTGGVDADRREEHVVVRGAT